MKNLRERIFVSADKTKATVIHMFNGARKETTYRIVGKKWVTTLEEVIAQYPNAEVLQELA